MPEDNTNNRFQMSLPDGWADQSVYIFDGPEAGGLHHSLSLVIDNVVPDDDLEDFARERVEAFLGATPSAELLKQEKKTLPGGTEAVEAVVKWIPNEGQIIFQKRVYLLIDEVGYSFTANFTKQTLKTIGLEVDRMISNFKPGGSV